MNDLQVTDLMSLEEFNQVVSQVEATVADMTPKGVHESAKLGVLLLLAQKHHWGDLRVSLFVEKILAG